MQQNQPKPEDVWPSSARGPRWFFGLNLALLIVLAGIWWWWAAAAQRALSSELQAAEEARASLPARKRPTTRNAADLYIDAARMLVVAPAAVEPYENVPWTLPLTPDELELIRRVHAPSQRILERVAEAERCDSVDWTLAEANWTAASEVLELARFLLLQALYEHQSGDDAAALACLHHCLLLSAAHDPESLYLSYLLRGRGCRTAEGTWQIATALSIDQRGPATKPASREQVQRLIQSLLDEEPVKANVAAEMAAWHAAVAEWVAPTVEEWTPGRFGWLYRPMPRWYAAGLLADARITRQATAQPTHPRAMSTLRASKQFWDRGSDKLLSDVLESGVYAMVGQLGADAFDRPGSYFSVLAHRRLAAVALAMRLYWLDNGRFPAALQDLVPRYLPAVPQDPFSPQEAPLRYNPTASQGPVLYSAGRDHSDDGGQEHSDIVVHLTRQPRTTRPFRGYFDPPDSEDSPAQSE